SDLRGFVLVSYQKLIFSFGKIAGNQVLKNFYPKGLRK
ncbi:MAG: RNA methyltransferase, partial [Lactobacillus crispatus]|nr:RNA methyltransferase [Lactobacillus crispatus]